VHFINDVNCVSTLRAIQHVIGTAVEFCVHHDTHEDDKTIETWHHTQTTHPTQEKPESRDNQSEAYLQCMSSGSNGRPKRIRRTHASWINSFQITAQTAQISTNDSYAIIGKLSHSLALYAALEAVWIGADVHALADIRPDKQFAALASLKSSVLYATPTQLRLMCNSATKTMHTNSSVKHIFCGGGKLDHHTTTLLTNHFPHACVKEFFGASETSFITISDQHTPIGSVGKPYPGVQLKIESIDSDSSISNENLNDDKPTQSIGEIWVKSAYLFEAYATGDEHDTRWHNGYLSIGEMGYVDSDANLFLTGRRSRMINIADNIVFPEQIENRLNQHESVRCCVVIPKPDVKRGVVLVAIVEAQEDEQLRAQLLRLNRAEFGTLKAPRSIIFVEKLPMLASGKPDIKTIERQFEFT